MILSIAIPMMIQNGITNFVNLLDNIMVGQLGTESMSGVAIANQLIFVFNLCVFGGISGAGIFCAQFFGSGNSEGVRQTFRFKLILCALLCVAFISIFMLFDDQLLSLYLHESDSGDLAMTLSEGKTYLMIMLVGLIPFAVTSSYVGTLRETGETMLPMKAGIAAVLVNFVFNWLLIFGNLGFPVMGVAGAAVATVLSRYVELVIVVVWAHTHKQKHPYMEGLYSSLHISGTLLASIIRKGWPLLLNELLYSIGTTMIIQCYSMRGLSAIAAVNISSTLSNLFKVVFFASGNAIAIIVGNLLGAGRMEEARETDYKMIFTSVVMCGLIGMALFIVAPLFPAMYNTTDEVRELATVFLRITAIIMPVMSFNHCCYFTLRSGGKTIITFIFDSMFIWVVLLPPTFAVAKLTALSVVFMYAMVQGLELIKSVLGFILVKGGSWISNIVIADI
ncbi:MAG: MATE family efflux transporter [Clostridia bacterium]|nr:MATE family efflux transporter [Clostridia bacterium]